MNWNDKDKLISWALTIFGFAVFWPLGLFGLFRILSNGSLFSRRPRVTGPVVDVPYTEVEEVPVRKVPENGRERKRPAVRSRNRGLVPIKRNWGRGLRIWGTILAALGGAILLTSLADGDISGPLDLFTDMAVESGILAAGAAMLAAGISRQKRAVRYRRYLSLIGEKSRVSIDALAEAMPTSYKKACADLQDMVEAGHLPAAGRLDLKTRSLLLADTLEDVPPPAAQERPVREQKDEDAALREMRELNDRIADAEMSRKIDRIGEITAKILNHLRNDPGSAEELRTFLDYYLPTTLKLLRAYAQMEAQGIEGKNIGETKAMINAAMDKVADGFEKQLDKLFQSDALDITSDIQVLEQMLQRDGLAAEELLF